MSRNLSAIVVVAVILLVCCCLTPAEIHRAKAIKSKPYHPGRATAQLRRFQAQQVAVWNVTRWFDGLNEFVSSWTGSERAPIWIYSLISSALVGLSGIFPLLVIPLEAGEALRKGASANGRLKLLLSFAVGGLLGDVFLHLLPEAWAHVDKLGGAHRGHIEIGLWVLTGLLSFMVIEKLFPENDDADDEDEEGMEEQADMFIEMTSEVSHTVGDDQDGESELRHRLVDKDYGTKSDKNGYVKNGFSKLASNTVTRHAVENGHVKNGHVMNGHVGNGCVKNGHVKNGCIGKDGGVKNPEVCTCKKNGYAKSLQPNGVVHSMHDAQLHSQKPPHIKTSGWLNLMANMIDNFTHGLAVAGSFSIGVKSGVITTLAILLHEVPHEIGDFAILLRAGFDRWKAAKAQLLTATGGILGAVAALSAESAQSAGDRTAWILPFTSGGFINIALVTVLPDLLRDNTDPWQAAKQFGLLCCGIAVMAAVTIFVD